MKDLMFIQSKKLKEVWEIQQRTLDSLKSKALQEEATKVKLVSEQDPVYAIGRKPRMPKEYDHQPIPCHHERNYK